jgi:hypothetical protein
VGAGDGRVGGGRCALASGCSPPLAGSARSGCSGAPPAKLEGIVDSSLFNMYQQIFLVLPPYRFNRQIHILRKKFDYKFDQQNIRYMIQNLDHWTHIQKMFPIV